MFGLPAIWPTCPPDAGAAGGEEHFFFKLSLFVKGSIFSPKLFKLWFPEVATDPDVCKEPLAAQEAMPSALREKVRDSF